MNRELSISKCDIKCCQQVKVQKTHVVIVGNGPSAISLSYILSGRRPFYDGETLKKFNETLHYRLLNQKDISIIDQNLELLATDLEGRSRNIISLLYDQLTNPGADEGEFEKSSLDWRFYPELEVPHVVIGKGLPGGVWQKMNKNIKSLSAGCLLQLPNQSLDRWLQSQEKNDTKGGKKTNKKLDPYERLKVAQVCDYMEDFIHSNDLKKYFFNNSYVVRLSRVRPENKDQTLWEVYGSNSIGQQFCYRAPYVVLATGASDRPNRLGVKGEGGVWVFHSSDQFQSHMSQIMSLSKNNARWRCQNCMLKNQIMKVFRFYDQPKPSAFFEDPLVVVGSGLSAADAVLFALEKQIPVKHLFRKDVEELKSTYLSLSSLTHSEYMRVFDLMRHKLVHHLYQAFPAVEVVQFTSDHKVIAKECDREETFEVKASLAVVLIGSQPDLSFMEEEVKKNLFFQDSPLQSSISKVFRPIIKMNPLTYQSSAYSGLYVMGPLAGEPFLRFLGGGALAVSSHIIKGSSSIDRV